MLEAAAHHARFGTVEGLEIIDGADVSALDLAADDDWQGAYADECQETDACREWTEGGVLCSV